MILNKKNLTISYDAEVDAAYIYLAQDTNIRVHHTYCCDPSEVNGMINLDFDKEGKLVGIEVIDASKKLPLDILK